MTDFYDTLLAGAIDGGGGGEAVLINKDISANGTYNASSDSADGYKKVVVNVPNPSTGTIQITQNGTVNVTNYASAEVNVQPPEEAEFKDVNFFDYDGTLLYSYTKQEWENVTELPANPSHNGLTAQGWNWTKAEINSQIANVPDSPVLVGQHYISASGDTEITIELIAPRLSPYLSLAVNGTVEIDWGDGSEKTTLTKSSTANITNTIHDYASEGTYVINVHRVSGSYYLCGTNASSSKYPVVNFNNATLNLNYIYSSAIKDIKVGNLGSSGGFGVNAFAGVELKSIPIPYNVDSSFGFNTSKFEFIVLPSGYTGNTPGGVVSALPDELHTICFPPTTTRIFLQNKTYLRNFTFVYGAGIEVKGFSGCSELRRVYIPSNVTSIPQDAFRHCYSLATITIPENVTTITAIAFGDCKGLGEIHVKPTIPPTVSSDSVFNSLSTDCVFYVPTASLSDYQTASIWSNYASRMVGE